MSNTILYIHTIFASFFMLYILIDRVYIRNWIEESQREKIYKKIKKELSELDDQLKTEELKE